MVYFYSYEGFRRNNIDEKMAKGDGSIEVKKIESCKECEEIKKELVEEILKENKNCDVIIFTAFNMI